MATTSGEFCVRAGHLDGDADSESEAVCISGGVVRLGKGIASGQEARDRQLVTTTSPRPASRCNLVAPARRRA
eukprot:8900225-Pyramimonas_sp.AAC.1